MLRQCLLKNRLPCRFRYAPVGAPRWVNLRTFCGVNVATGSAVVWHPVFFSAGAAALPGINSRPTPVHFVLDIPCRVLNRCGRSALWSTILPGLPQAKATVPHPPTVPVSRTLLDIPKTARRPLVAFDDYHAAHGDNFLFSMGGSRRTHVTIDADVFQHVMQRNHRNYEKSDIQTVHIARYFGYGLLTNGGQSWLTQRRVIQPGFHRKRLEHLTDAMLSVIRQQVTRLDGHVASGEPIDLHHFTRDAVFRIITRAIFTDGFDAEATARLNHAIDRVQSFVIYPARVPALTKPLRWLGLEGKHLRLVQELRADIQQRIDARRAGTPQDDLLQMLLDVRYEDTGEPMTDEQLIDEIFILFAAGHETSANALAWTIWLLLRHPAELARVQEEVAAVGPLGFDAVRRLPHLTRCIEESLRLYPPAWLVDRVALADDAAGEVVIDRGTVLGLYISGLHRNPRYWDDPAAFRPDRMTPAAKKARHPYCYLPFGGGPRLCIGNHFAMLEMQLFLATVLRDYALTLPADAAAVTPKPLITLHMDRPLLVRVARRANI